MPILSCLILESTESSTSGKCRIKLRPLLLMKLLGASVLALWVVRLTNYFIIGLETLSHPWTTTGLPYKGRIPTAQHRKD